MEPLRWTALEYEDKERTPDWFWGLGIVALAFTVLSIYFGNYLLAILIIVSGFSLALFAVRKPEHVEYELQEDGVRVNNTLYPFNTLESFWVEKFGVEPKIIIVSKKFFVPHIIIPIADHDPKKIRGFLLNNLEEVEHHEPLLHIITERLGM